MLHRTVLVGAMGYFVDIYDLVLFGVVRQESLTALGVPADELLDVGVALLNWQMAGLLLGGIIWCVLGDKRGRVSVLFGSILLYSAANLANAFVTTIPQYAALRFVAGVGLAGELGAAITLVSEVLPRDLRGYGAAVVAAVGILGAVFGGIVGNVLAWQHAYLLGGFLGLGLLAVRYKMRDSGMYASMQRKEVRRGDLRLLLTGRDRVARYVRCILIGVPLWFVIGILVTFSPELAAELGATGPILAGTAVVAAYAGLSVGDLGSGYLSQWVRSRWWVILGFLGLTAALVFVYFFARGLTPPAFYALCFGLGIGAGYWAVFVTNAAEQFGTNLRATVTTTTPNFVRGSVVPVTLGFQALAAPLGLARAALAAG
ncbi:MAG: MFS transporter, partial [bacterium]